VRNFQGGFEIELVGEIVNMIDAAQPVPHNATSAAREADSIKHYASSVKVVAGARNQRYLHLDYAALKL